MKIAAELSQEIPDDLTRSAPPGLMQAVGQEQVERVIRQIFLKYDSILHWAQ